ncbi:MAG: OmpA family protein [Rhodobacteraceae bacterium]|nr:OmpA family protein [Paracoccaceae bacterium]
MTLRPLAILALLGLLPFGAALAQDSPAPPDLMSFAQGVLPVAVSTGEADLRVTPVQAIAAIDGNPVGFVMTPRFGTPADAVEITYALPAPTRFERFAVPNVLETPSPSQTFFRDIQVLGSATSAEGPFVPLASGALSTHEARGTVTELTLSAAQPDVLWVKLRLSDGVDVQVEKTFFEFSELIGNGTQQAAPLSEGFSGVWDGRGVDIELAQEGASVTGCYDGESALAGTVDGKVLRAMGENAAGIPSQFILIAAEDGGLRGLRSTNGAPFKPYDGEASDAAPVCLAPEPVLPGCGAVLHGIGFDFDSDVIRAESQPLLAALSEGLSGATGVEIIGHSSSEGAEDYNRDLSQRRAASVVAALVALGLDGAQITATGRGEDDPIASNDDEAGRSMNRRVEVRCGE